MPLTDRDEDGYARTLPRPRSGPKGRAHCSWKAPICGEARILESPTYKSWAQGDQDAQERYRSTTHDSPLMGKISNNQITVRAEAWVFPGSSCVGSLRACEKAWSANRRPPNAEVELVRFITGFCARAIVTEVSTESLV